MESFFSNKILHGSPIYITSQSVAEMNKMKAIGLELHSFLLFAFHLPPVPVAPPKNLKGATEHL